MIFPDKTTESKNLPTLSECVRYIRENVGRIPIMHRGPLDPIVTNEDCFIPTKLMSGRFSLKPNITTQAVLYRGQSRYEEVCTAQLFRTPPPYVVENIKLLEFRYALESHPLYQLFKSGIAFPDGTIWSIENPYGLAMSYGLTTGLISLSSSLDIAAFHSVAHYDASERLYRYVGGRESEEGVLYVFVLNRPFSMFPGLSTVGLQPFSRPGLLKEFAFELSRYVDFNNLNPVAGFRFRHTEEDDLYYYQLFDEGRKLLEESDELAIKASNIRDSRELMASAFEQNLRDNPMDNRVNNASIIFNKGYQISNTRQVAFSEEDLTDYYSNSLSRWEGICQSIFFGGKKADERREWMMNLPDNNNFRRFFERV